MSTEPNPFDHGPEPRSGREPLRARSEYGLRLGFAVFGVVVGVALAIWAIVTIVQNDVNLVLVFLAVVFLVGSIVNVIGISRARINDARLRSDPPDDGAA